MFILRACVCVSLSLIKRNATTYIHLDLVFFLLRISFFLFFFENYEFVCVWAWIVWGTIPNHAVNRVGQYSTQLHGVFARPLCVSFTFPEKTVHSSNMTVKTMTKTTVNKHLNFAMKKLFCVHRNPWKFSPTNVFRSFHTKIRCSRSEVILGFSWKSPTFYPNLSSLRFFFHFTNPRVSTFVPTNKRNNNVQMNDNTKRKTTIY